MTIPFWNMVCCGKRCQGCGQTEILIYFWWVCTSVQPLGEWLQNGKKVKDVHIIWSRSSVPRETLALCAKNIHERSACHNKIWSNLSFCDQKGERNYGIFICNYEDKRATDTNINMDKSHNMMFSEKTNCVIKIRYDTFELKLKHAVRMYGWDHTM